MLSEENRTKLDSIVGQMETNGEKPEDIQFVVDDFKTKYTSAEQPTGLKADLSKRFETARAGVEQAQQGKQTAPSAVLQTTGQIAGAVGDIGFAGLKAITPDVIEKPIGAAISKGIQKIAETKPAMWGIEKYQGFKSEHPEAAADLEALANIASILPPVKGVQLAAKPTGQIIKKGEILASRLTSQSEKQIEKTIVKKYEKGIKPLLPGKTSPKLLQNYRDDVVVAIKTIKENQPDLSFTDEVGDIITGKIPTTLHELSESVEQTKKSVFNKYDALAKQTGEAGIKVEMNPVANELNTIIGNEAFQLAAPDTVKYAQAVQERLMDKQFSVPVVQEAVQIYNKSLEAYYRNPSYETASKAAVDAMIANKMRMMLDEKITGLTGAQYQVLKNQYGSLKAIERDVIKASLREARKDVKGLIDLTDVFSGGQVVTGILHLDPALIATGVAQKSISSYYKYLNSPNKAIKNMFEATEKLKLQTSR